MAFFKRVIGIFISTLMFKIGLPKKVVDTSAYTKSFASHSDYRKFDDMLRMNIDCSPKQIDQITEYLQILYKQGKIYYGLHQSNNSLMTCFVDGLGYGNHIHFIDGDDGGYAKAAQKLKVQMQSG